MLALGLGARAAEHRVALGETPEAGDDLALAERLVQRVGQTRILGRRRGEERHRLVPRRQALGVEAGVVAEPSGSRRERPRTEPEREDVRGRAYFAPALKLVKMRVCTRRMSCGTASGAVSFFMSSGDRKTVGLFATSFFTNFFDARFGFA